MSQGSEGKWKIASQVSFNHYHNLRKWLVEFLSDVQGIFGIELKM